MLMKRSCVLMTVIKEVSEDKVMKTLELSMTVSRIFIVNGYAADFGPFCGGRERFR